MADHPHDEVPLGGDDDEPTPRPASHRAPGPQGPPRPRFEDVVRGLNLPGVDAVAGGAMLDTLLAALRPVDPVEGLQDGPARDRARALLVAGKALPGGSALALQALARFVLDGTPRG